MYMLFCVYYLLTMVIACNTVITNNASSFCWQIFGRRVLHDRSTPYNQQFTHFNSDDFARWILHQGISADDLFNQHQLYQYDAFMDLLRQQTAYQERISALHNKLEVDYEHGISRACGYLTGNYTPGLRERVAQEFAQIERQRAKDRGQQQQLRNQHICTARIHKEIEVHTRNTLQSNAQKLAQAAAQWRSYPHLSRFKKRADALADITQNDHHAYTHQNYQLDRAVTEHAQFTQDQIAALSSCYGNQVQHVLHQEFVDIVHLSSNSAIARVLGTQFKNCLPEMVDLGVQANKSGYVLEASVLADCCWALLDCAQAIAEGVVDGCVATAQSVVDAVTHPVDTATHLISSIATLARTVASAACVVPELGYYYVTDTQRYYLRQHEIAAYATSVCNVLQNHIENTPRHELIRSATSFVTHALLVDRILGVCARIATQIPPLIKQALPTGTPQPVYALITAPGAQNTHPAMDIAIPAILSDAGIAPEIVLHKKIAKAAQVLGPAGEELSLHLLTLEREIPHFIKVLENTCSWLRSHNIPIPKIDWMHLFGMDLMPSKQQLKLGGFHHDYLSTLEKSGAIRTHIIEQTAEGFYEAQVWVAGVMAQPPKTFFPQHWTREQVVQCVMDTYQDCLKQKIQPELKPSGKYLLKKEIKSGLEIHFYLDQKMNIKTVYPVIVGTKK